MIASRRVFDCRAKPLGPWPEDAEPNVVFVGIVDSLSGDVWPGDQFLLSEDLTIVFRGDGAWVGYDKDGVLCGGPHWAPKGSIGCMG